MLKSILRGALAAVALAAGASQAQVPCGTTLHASITLTAHMRCANGVDGLVIGTDNVRIELNGFTIRGPYTLARPTRPATGIRSSGFWNVQVVGPGAINGFTTVIDIEGGGNHVVDGVQATAQAGMPVALRNVSGSAVQGSRLTGITLSADARSKATGNRIVNNDVGPLPGFYGGGIAVQGCGAADNMVAGNFIHPDYAHAVSVYDGARATQVLKNKIERGQVYLFGSSDNVVSGNSWANDGVTTAAVEIESSGAPVACAGGAVLGGKGNIVRGNFVDAGHFGVLVDDVTGASLSTGNLVTANTFQNQAYSGLIFGPGAVYNDARGNTYVNTLYAYDFGVGNLWP